MIDATMYTTHSTWRFVSFPMPVKGNVSRGFGLRVHSNKAFGRFTAARACTVRAVPCACAAGVRPGRATYGSHTSLEREDEDERT
jgi:hypothetical protein